MRRMTESALDPDLLNRLRSAVGPKGLVEDAERDGYLREWRDRYHGETPLILRPGSVSELSEIVRLCHETGTPMVPQGGNTGLVGGQIPFGNQVLISLQRLNSIRGVYAEDNALVVEAGVTLAEAQDAAFKAERYFPLSLAAEGTATVGGAIASNAGGLNVLRYGNARELVLGLEVVLPAGKIWSDLKRLRKDNTGYDLKHLFIGSEGTLGFVTAASLRLFAKPGAVETAFCTLTNCESGIGLLALAQAVSGDRVTSFELIPRIGLDFVLKHREGTRDPLAAKTEWYALIEISGGAEEDLRPRFEQLLSGALEQGLVTDAALAENTRQAEEFWALREALSEVQKHEGGSIKHDVSVPISAMPAFIAEASEAVRALIPGCRPVAFGHMGDGNVHFNVSQPEGADKAAFLARWEEVAERVHAIALRYDGSISAEHGIGVMKREGLAAMEGPLAMTLMRRIKDAFDPKGLMNPGKVL